MENKVIADIKETRHVCQVLGEMRACHKTRNYAGLLGLIEQVQGYVNRMEDGLSATRHTSYQAYDLIRANKFVEAEKIIEHRWPRIKDRT